MSYHPRRILPPGAASRKRKDMEAFYASKQPQPTKPALSAQADLASSNRLLAGYMAYEFLTKGTILGQSYDPARAEAVPVMSASTADWKRMKVPPPAPSPRRQTPKPESNKEAPVKAGERESYYEVTNLLKTDGAHVPGVVNPAQISRWIHM